MLMSGEERESWGGGGGTAMETRGASLGVSPEPAGLLFAFQHAWCLAHALDTN